jgi:hypothetical protein
MPQENVIFLNESPVGSSEHMVIDLTEEKNKQLLRSRRVYTAYKDNVVNDIEQGVSAHVCAKKLCYFCGKCQMCALKSFCIVKRSMPRGDVFMCAEHITCPLINNHLLNMNNIYILIFWFIQFVF